MWNAGSNEDEVARMELLNRIPHDPFARALGNKTELKLLVVVPPALIDVILEDSYEKGLLRI